jgi:hypothetical protein
VLVAVVLVCAVGAVALLVVALVALGDG